MRAPVAAVLVLALLATGCAVPSSPREGASPLFLEPGLDVGSAYLPSLAIQDDGGLDARVVGVPGATVRLTDAFRLTNRGDGPLDVEVAPPADPGWSVGLGAAGSAQGLLAPGETLVGWLALTLPESGAEGATARFDVHGRVHR